MGSFIQLLYTYHGYSLALCARNLLLCIVCSVICILIYHNKPFLGNEIYSFDIKTKSVKKKVWAHLPNCTSAFRWLEHYYCFHGYSFTRFHPVSGDVTGAYPKAARNYFMRCEGFGESLNVTHKVHLSPAFKKFNFILNLFST